VQCAAPGLRFLQALAKHNGLGVYMANGVAEVLPFQPFQVRVLNSSPRERKLPKGMILGHSLPHPKGIVALVEDDDRAIAEIPASLVTRAAASEPEVPPLPDRPDVDDRLWREDVNLTHLPPHERDQVLRVLEKHRSMWDGRLGHVHAPNHKLELRVLTVRSSRRGWTDVN
jgi:hypothetical protein